jgi:hypothetical protein
MSDEARARLIATVTAALDDHVRDGVLTFPIEAHLGSARK